MTEWEKRGKEASPEETVKRAQAIIRELGYEVIVNEFDSDLVKDCYSCRIWLNNGGEAIAANGKGMTKGLSLASGHGELLERLQNRIFSVVPRRDDEKYEDFLVAGTPLYDPVTGENETECFTRIIEKLAKTVSSHQLFMTDEEFVRQLFSKLSVKSLGNKMPTSPFYSLKDDEIVYIPDMIALFTGSNGMAAGNTYEEAMIEGISELLERYSQAIIMDGEVIPPQIPRDYIAKYPHIMKIIEDIERSGRYKVRLLDCSLGKKLPVVCGLVIDKKTGSFGAKFGAQPNVAIAMERVFTEAMQGADLENFVSRSMPDVGVAENIKRRDKWNNMKVAVGSVTSQLLMDSPTYDFAPWEDVEGKSNPEIMRELIQLLEDEGADVYVRDTGYLDFPSVNIYATGISELRPMDIPALKTEILASKVAQYFSRIDTLTDEEVSEIALLASVRMGAILENTISAISMLFFKDEMPIPGCETEFLYAVCLYRLGKLSEACGIFKSISQTVTYHTYYDLKYRRYIDAIYYYLTAKNDGICEEQAFDLIRNLYEDEADRVRDEFGDPKCVLQKIYPVCGGKSIVEITEGGAQYGFVHEFYKLLISKENEKPMQIDKVRAIFKK